MSDVKESEEKKNVMKEGVGEKWKKREEDRNMLYE